MSAGPVTHEDLYRLEGRVDARIDSERAERISAIAGIKHEVMTEVRNLHKENTARLSAIDHTTRNSAESLAALGERQKSTEKWQDSFSGKMDTLLHFKSSADGSVAVGRDVGKIAGWVVAALISLAALFLHK